MGRRGHFLVVVLVLTVEKAIEHEDENDNDNGKRRDFRIGLLGTRHLVEVRSADQRD
jgi:hypothetical protein